MLQLLTSERIRRATQLSNDLFLDLDVIEVTIETEGMLELFRAVEGLSLRISRMFPK